MGVQIDHSYTVPSKLFDIIEVSGCHKGSISCIVIVPENPFKKRKDSSVRREDRLIRECGTRGSGSRVGRPG